MPPFSSLADRIKKSLTPITDRLREQFGIGKKLPSETLSTPPVDNFTRAPSASSTPIADSLRQRFAPSQEAPSFLDRYASAAASRESALKSSVSPFLKTVLEKAGLTVREAAPAVDAAVKQAVDGFYQKRKDLAFGAAGDIARGDFEAARKRTLDVLADSGLGTLKVAGVLAQGLNEGVFNIGTSLAKAALPGYEIPQPKEGEPSLLRDLTGRDRLTTYQESASDLYGWSLENGASENEAKFLAGFGVLGRFLIDEPGFGGAGKGAIRLSTESISKMAKAETDEAVATILKAENPQIADDAVAAMSPMFRAATTPEDVQNVVKIVERSIKAAETKARKLEIRERAKAQEIPSELRALADEARAAASPDDFRKVVSNREFRYDDSVKPDARIGTIPIARFDGQDIRASQSTVEKAGVKEWEKRIEAGERPRVLVEMKEDGPRVIDGHTRLTAYKNLGIKEIPVLDNGGKVVADGEPLSDFYTRAASSPKKEPAKISGDIFVGRNDPVDPNLVKSLGVAKDPYEALNILKNAFPNLPDRVVDRFVDRFIKTKRTANVENLIKAARNLDQAMKPGGSIRVAGEPKSVGAIIKETVPKGARKYLRQDQKLAMIRTLKDKFEDPKAAVAAEGEYSRIWDDLNQKIVDEYDNISMQKGFLEDVLAAEESGLDRVYKRLFTGPNKGKAADDSIMELQEIQNRASRHKKALANYKRTGASGDKLFPGKPKPLTKTEEYASELDVWLKEAGYDDWGDAQIAMEKYQATLAEVKALDARLKLLRPRVREAKILQEGLDEIAVIPQKEVEAIDRLMTPQNFRDNFNDISGFAGQARDMTRNFEHFFGKEYPAVKKWIVDPFEEATGARVDEVEAIGKDLGDNVIEKLGIARGSKESAAIQRYGDTDLPAGQQMTYDDLVKEFGREKADNIVAADAWFRKTYDRLIDELNVVRKKIYPRNPGKLIAKRKNYYRHFREMGDEWGDALREFFETPSGIAPNLVGTSEFTKAKTRFLPFAESRMTQNTDLDAVGGFLEYADLFSYAKHIDPQVPKFRYLHRKLGEVAPKVGEEIKLPNGGTAKTKGAENFLTFLDDFARDLTGNTNPMDRFIQKIIGRKNIRVARFINNRMKANTIGGNLGSALAQVANVPAGLADTGPLYFSKGLKRALAGTVIENQATKKSIFLKGRYQKALKEKFPLRFGDKPLRASGDRARQVAGWILRRADMAGTTAIWNAQYEKALGLAKKGKDVGDPIKYADDRTKKIVAGRDVGDVPLGQKALMTQFIAPFTLEVGNAWWIMKGWTKEKQFASLITFFVANYVLNEIAENVRGSRITYDPINALVQGSVSLAEESGEGNYTRGGIKFLGRQAGEFLANIPFGQTFAAAVPEENVKQITQWSTGAPMTKQDIFGDSTAGRFGTPLIVSGLKDAVFRLLPPVGGLQLKKTYDGIMALINGYAKDSKGNKTFDVPPTALNIVRALGFGANATSEAREYFRERTDLFNRLERQEADSFIRAAAAEKDWADIKALSEAGKGEEAASKLAELVQKDKVAAEAVVAIAKAEAQGLNGNDRLIKMLNVKNGERAKYVVEQMKKMTGDERAAFLADLAQKKLVSKDVLAQIAFLWKVR